MKKVFLPVAFLLSAGVIFLFSYIHNCECRDNLSAKSYAKISPVDESNRREDFRIFRDELINACRRKDVKFLLQHTDENICYSFGALENTKSAFIKALKLDKMPERSFIWEELSFILQMGGIFEKDGSFVAPWSFALFPSGDDFDSFQELVCISSDVPLYSEPSAKSDIIKKMSYDIVKFSDDRNGYYDYWRYKGGSGWLKVKTQKGEEGYVLNNKYVRSPIDYRAVFIKKDGVWKMTDFVSGD